MCCKPQKYLLNILFYENNLNSVLYSATSFSNNTRTAVIGLPLKWTSIYNCFLERASLVMASNPDRNYY